MNDQRTPSYRPMETRCYKRVYVYGGDAVRFDEKKKDGRKEGNKRLRLNAGGEETYVDGLSVSQEEEEEGCSLQGVGQIGGFWKNVMREEVKGSF